MAEALGKTIAEIDAMTVAEFHGWQAFYAVRAEKQKKKRK